MALSGVTYYKTNCEKSGYIGDKTKGCGLTGAEIDDNFHFLRGYDIYNAGWDQKQNAIILQRVNGDELKISAEELKPIVEASADYNPESGTLTLTLNDVPIEVSGFSTCDCEEIWNVINQLIGKTAELECRVKQAYDMALEAEEAVGRFDGEIKHLDDKIDEKVDDLNERIDNILVSGGSPYWNVIDY